MRNTSLAILAVPMGAAVAQFAPAMSAIPAGRRVFPVIARVPGARSVALTFDDGPDVALDQFLMLLDRAGARATFFLVGEQVVLRPTAPTAIIAAGHEVAVHGYTHRGHLRRAPWEVADDLRRARAVIEETAQTEMRLFRPPYGLFSLGSWMESSRLGWSRVLWSRWGRDWEAGATPQHIVDCIGFPQPGDILLLHDSDRYSAPGSWKNTLAALPAIIERVCQAGLAIRSVRDLLNEAGQVTHE